MRTLTFHTIAPLLTIVMVLSVNSAQAQPGTQTKLVVTSISLTPTAASVTVGQTLQFKVTAGFNNGSMKIVTSPASWSSSDSQIASIGSAGQPSPGLATGVAPGNVNITASFSGVSAVTTLNVTGTGATLTSFFVSQINPSIAPWGEAAAIRLCGIQRRLGELGYEHDELDVFELLRRGYSESGPNDSWSGYRGGGDWHDNRNGEVRGTDALHNRQGRR